MLIWGACFLIHVFFWPIICLIWEEGGAICIGITRFWEHQLEVVIEEVFLGQTKLPTPALNLKNNSYRYSNIHTHLSLEHAFNTEAKVNHHSALYNPSPPAAATHGSKGSAAHWCAAASPGTQLPQAESTWQEPRPHLCWTSLHNSINRMMITTSTSLESVEDTENSTAAYWWWGCGAGPCSWQCTWASWSTLWPADRPQPGWCRSPAPALAPAPL